MLHAPRRERALVIGYGTGVTARTCAIADFARVDVAELAGDVVHLADAHFSAVNGGVSAAPNVHVHTTDGRNYLLLDRGSYDVVSIEVSSIWFRGAAALYNQEFYRLVRARLAPGGVLQQWIQLHHIRLGDVATILATLRSVFGEVYLYERGGQGIVVVCDGSCAASSTARAELEDRPAVRALFALAGGDDSARDALVLGPEAVDRLLARTQAPVSTDDDSRLEYATPKGNAETTPAPEILARLVELAR
jgi:spermidine synthase